MVTAASVKQGRVQLYLLSRGFRMVSPSYIDKIISTLFEKNKWEKLTICLDWGAYPYQCLRYLESDSRDHLGTLWEVKLPVCTSLSRLASSLELRDNLVIDFRIPFKFWKVFSQSLRVYAPRN